MNIQERIYNACNDNNVQYRSYSGRAMYGKNCVGIVGSMKECQQVISDVIQTVVDELFDSAVDCTDEDVNQVYQFRSDVADLIQTITQWKSDSMGLDVVLYWPDVKFDDSFIPVEEDEEEDA